MTKRKGITSTATARREMLRNICTCFSSQRAFNCGSSTGKKKLNIRKFDCPHCGTQNLDRDINASINIRNYGLGQLDNRNTAGTVEIQACGVSSSGITTSYGVVVSYDTMKQEAQSSLAVG